MLVKDAKLLGNISKGNTKMPGTTFAIDAFACNTGSKLAKIAGTPCSVCYARHLQRIRPSVDQGWKANLAKFNQAVATDNLTAWIDAITFQILRYNTDLHHRWFDSGDLQSVEMLKAICEVCNLTPQIKHWLPTQERAIVQEFKRSNKIPANLVIRVSASKINGNLPNADNTSNVFTTTDHIHGTDGKALERGNNCGPCRACWSHDVKNVSYPKH